MALEKQEGLGDVLTGAMRTPQTNTTSAGTMPAPPTPEAPLASLPTAHPEPQSMGTPDLTSRALSVAAPLSEPQISRWWLHIFNFQNL